jgi:hypothetical protein
MSNLSDTLKVRLYQRVGVVEFYVLQSDFVPDMPSNSLLAQAIGPIITYRRNGGGSWQDFSAMMKK